MSNKSSICLFAYKKYFINTISNDIDELVEYHNNTALTTTALTNNIDIFKCIYNIVRSSIYDSSVFNFVSIGSASNLDSKYYSIIPSYDNHQLPTFIVDIIDKNEYQEYNMFLIDERLEEPPYIIQNSKYSFTKNDEYIYDNKSNHWKSNNINVYSFNSNIYNYKSELIYIKKIIECIKQEQQEQQGQLIINDYSGLELDRIFEYELMTYSY